jgi:hypothetical protein
MRLPTGVHPATPAMRSTALRHKAACPCEIGLSYINSTTLVSNSCVQYLLHGCTYHFACVSSPVGRHVLHVLLHLVSSMFPCTTPSFNSNPLIHVRGSCILPQWMNTTMSSRSPYRATHWTKTLLSTNWATRMNLRGLLGFSA